MRQVPRWDSFPPPPVKHETLSVSILTHLCALTFMRSPLDVPGHRCGTQFFDDRKLLPPSNAVCSAHRLALPSPPLNSSRLPSIPQFPVTIFVLPRPPPCVAVTRRFFPPFSRFPPPPVKRLSSSLWNHAPCPSPSQVHLTIVFSGFVAHLL